MAKRTGSKKRHVSHKSGGKRELIDTGTDKRYVRRDAGGRFKERFRKYTPHLGWITSRGFFMARMIARLSGNPSQLAAVERHDRGRKSA